MFVLLSSKQSLPQFFFKYYLWDTGQVEMLKKALTQNYILDILQGMGVLRRWMKEEYNNENLLFYQPHMVQLVLMRYVTMHSLHR